MNYIGKLYGKMGIGAYFETGKTSDDWDKLESELKEVKKELQAERIKALSQAEQADESKWISVEDSPENEGEIVLYNENWINEDWNPKGIRVGFWDDVSGWTSAYWCNYHDDYHTRVSEEDDNQFTDEKGINQIPTHWQPLPDKPNI